MSLPQIGNILSLTGKLSSLKHYFLLIEAVTVEVII